MANSSYEPTTDDKVEQDTSLDERAMLNFVRAAASSISMGDIEQIAALVSAFKFGCDIEIFNNTPYCWVASSHYARHGKFADGMMTLPAIPPVYVDKTQSRTIFSEGVAVTNRDKSFVRPKCVMIWEALDSDLYLIVYIDVFAHNSNQGYFTLTTDSPGTAEEWYDSNEGLRYSHGSISKKCKTTVNGVTIDGSLNDGVSPAAMRIDLTV